MLVRRKLFLKGLLLVLVSFTTSFRFSKILPKVSSTRLEWTTFHAEGRDTRKNIDLAKVTSSIVHTLLIDNYDSYTYNLYQLLSDVNGVEPHVIFNDDFKDWESLLENCPHFDNIVISPGPGSPSCSKDIGICKEAVLKAQVPVLGVCLGHQGIAEVFGMPVLRALRPVHGERFAVNHTGTGLFQGLPQGFQVVRYHSLVAAPAVEIPLRITAWTSDGVVMGVEHISKPIYGVQFHPESILSEFGSELISTFKSITLKHSSKSSTRAKRLPSVRTLPRVVHKNIDGDDNKKSLEEMLYFHTTKVSIPSSFTFEDVVRYLYEKSNASFWLDTSREPVNMAITERVVSFAGAVDVHGSGQVIEYWGDKLVFRNVHGEVTKNSTESIFDFIDSFTKAKPPSVICDASCSENSLPFTPDRKIFGHISYEARHVTTARMHGRSENTIPDRFTLPSSASPSSSSSIPLSVFFQPTQYLVYDHSTTSVFIVSEGKSATIVPAELTKIKGEMLELFEKRLPLVIDKKIVGNYREQEDRCLTARKTREQYKKDVSACKDYITAGESYEICMTIQFTSKCNLSAFDVYSALRKNNPAPYSCLMQYRSRACEYAICCSSPERYLRIDGATRIMDSKPIKGTARRLLHKSVEEDVAVAVALAKDVKTMAENLMIVDLVRNDFGRVCKIGSVHVPLLMSTESFSTVHQLVSSIEGRICKDKTVSDAICATFPGGSMTGAPKLRAMSIIDELERSNRGIYSGCIGHISADGSTDLNIVIRTALLSNGELTVGAGGAITALSISEEEVAEVELKASAVAGAIGYSVKFREEWY